ncbi:2OG-Fe(II) oxygenase [Pseudokordiimonas caeni]|uniref:2OG-Fe(II) oxygenase n=1 Tax=Pseudokordiimonas caeni TaxID=2997908 RepID=UPI0028121519|nr:2OG-Fe(II) oxygenase [Pseudokordiimonas caeni]
MLNLIASEVKQAPFPHIVSDRILEESLFNALRADYPDASIFEGQKGVSGMSGSRTGQGFDIYRGDEAYSALMAKSEAWREFDAYINSRTFVEKFVELFGDRLADTGCSVEISPDKYERDYIEPRHVMTAHETLKSKILDLGRHILPKKARKPVPLFSRLDIHKALTGYAKQVHCDRPNRLCSLIIYFTDADEAGIVGGDLTIHQHKVDKPFTEYERHPKPEDAPVIAKLRPKKNRGVFFPCCNNSYHGVTAVETQGKERDYLYINISGHGDSIWY